MKVTIFIQRKILRILLIFSFYYFLFFFSFLFFFMDYSTVTHCVIETSHLRHFPLVLNVTDCSLCYLTICSVFIPKYVPLVFHSQLPVSPFIPLFSVLYPPVPFYKRWMERKLSQFLPVLQFPSPLIGALVVSWIPDSKLFSLITLKILLHCLLALSLLMESWITFFICLLFTCFICRWAFLFSLCGSF